MCTCMVSSRVNVSSHNMTDGFFKLCSIDVTYKMTILISPLYVWEHVIFVVSLNLEVLLQVLHL